MPVIVNERECVVCGICAAACPSEAIRACGIAVIDANKCTDCSVKACIKNCPTESLIETEI